DAGGRDRADRGLVLREPAAGVVDGVGADQEDAPAAIERPRQARRVVEVGCPDRDAARGERGEPGRVPRGGGDRVGGGWCGTRAEQQFEDGATELAASAGDEDRHHELLSASSVGLRPTCDNARVLPSGCPPTTSQRPRTPACWNTGPAPSTTMGRS